MIHVNQKYQVKNCWIQNISMMKVLWFDISDAPFDCENAAKIVLDKIRSKGCKTRRTSSRYKSLRLKTAAMFGIANKKSISDQHSQSSIKKIDRVLATQKWLEMRDGSNHYLITKCIDIVKTMIRFCNVYV